MVHRICLGCDQVHDRPKLVIIPVAGLGTQRDPFVDRAAQPRIARHKVIHVVEVDGLAGAVRAAQADKNVVPGLADGELVFEIELSGFLSA